MIKNEGVWIVSECTVHTVNWFSSVVPNRGLRAHTASEWLRTLATESQGILEPTSQGWSRGARLKYYPKWVGVLWSIWKMSGLPMMWKSGVEWHFTPDGKAWHIALQLLATALQCPVGQALFGESTAFLSTTITFKELFWSSYAWLIITLDWLRYDWGPCRPAP